MDYYCTRCDLVVLKAGKGQLVQDKPQPLPLERSKADAVETESVSEWVHVRDMYDFENICYSRDHKNLAGGVRVLTCAGCEKGVLGLATPVGSGPDMKMDTYLAPCRVARK